MHVYTYILDSRPGVNHFLEFITYFFISEKDAILGYYGEHTFHKNTIDFKQRKQVAIVGKVNIHHLQTPTYSSTELLNPLSYSSKYLINVLLRSFPYLPVDILVKFLIFYILLDIATVGWLVTCLPH